MKPKTEYVGKYRTLGWPSRETFNNDTPPESNVMHDNLVEAREYARHILTAQYQDECSLSAGTQVNLLTFAQIVRIKDGQIMAEINA